MSTLGARLLSWLLLGVVLLDDALISAVDLPVPVLAPFDWLGHLATTAIVLLALAPRALLRRRLLVAGILAAGVLIDLDHLVLYAGLSDGVQGGRPASHSLVTPALSLLLALLLPRGRTLLTAWALGVGLHLLRDTSTGPGIPWAAPFSDTVLLLHYGWYAALLAALCALATARATSPARGRRAVVVP